MKNLRTHEVEHQLQLFLAGVTGDVDVGLLVMDDFRAAPIEVVDHMRDRALVAGNRARGQDDDVATLDLDLLVLADGDACECRRRLALRTGGHDDELARRNLRRRGARLARKLQIAEALGGLDVVDERATDEQHLAAMLAREVDDLLHAMDVRGERRDEHASRRQGEDPFDCAADGLLRGTVAGHERIRRIAAEKRHPLLAVVRETSDVGRLGVDRRVIDLEIARVDDRPGRRRDREGERVDDRVRHANRFDLEHAGLDDLARHESAADRRLRSRTPRACRRRIRARAAFRRPGSAGARRETARRRCDPRARA